MPEKRNSDKTEALEKIASCLTSLGSDFDQNITILTGLCGELLGAACALYNRLHGRILKSDGMWNTPPDYEPEDCPDGHICFDVISRQDCRFLHIRDLLNSPYADSDPNVKKYQLKTYLGQAVYFRERPVGSLCTVYVNDFIPDETDLMILRLISKAISAEENRRDYVMYDLSSGKSELSDFFDSLPALVAFIDSEEKYRFTNQSYADFFGYNRREIRGKKICDVAGEYYSRVSLKIAEAIKGTPQKFETTALDFSGKEKTLLVQYTPYKDQNSELAGFSVVSMDITTKKEEEARKREIEQKILETQKLESLGVLAGGIAHDFNNILMAVIGYADLAMMDIPAHSPARESIGEVVTASRKAAALCQQMLAYSGKGRFKLEMIDLSQMVDEMVHLLKTTISKKAVLNLKLDRNLPGFIGDTTQIRQIILNLITNASEAVGEKSGAISLSTGAMYCDEGYFDAALFIQGMNPGFYVTLEVSDTGSGIRKEDIPRIFEPFYTTKFTGRGLGLSAVLGIVRGHKGALKVYSEEGKGTTFKILFPASEESETVSKTSNINDSDDRQSFSGKVLLVDDEETVRALCRKMLEKMGFEVITACDGREAVKIFSQKKDEISLVILDLTMPHMNGDEAFREMRRIREDVTVVLSSGYNQQELTQRFAGKGMAGFIQKPYTSRNLSELLQKMFRK